MKWIEKLRTEDWVTVWMSIPLLVLAVCFPKEMPSVPRP